MARPQCGTTPCLFGYLGNIISLGQNIVKFGSIQSEIVQGKGVKYNFFKNKKLFINVLK